jgi:hypothetical protein
MFLVMCHHSYNRGDSTSPKNSGLRAQPALVQDRTLMEEKVEVVGLLIRNKCKEGGLPRR